MLSEDEILNELKTEPERWFPVSYVVKNISEKTGCCERTIYKTIKSMARWNAILLKKDYDERGYWVCFVKSKT